MTAPAGPRGPITTSLYDAGASPGGGGLELLIGADDDYGVHPSHRVERDERDERDEVSLSGWAREGSSPGAAELDALDAPVARGGSAATAT